MINKNKPREELPLRVSVVRIMLKGRNRREFHLRKESLVCMCSRKRRMLKVWSRVTKKNTFKYLVRIHGEVNGNPLQYSCLENPMDGRAWWAAVHGVAKDRTGLSFFTFTFHFHALDKEMATHSSILAWRIPGKGESVGLLSMGLHRIGHD